jgi:hypothetical protein
MVQKRTIEESLRGAKTLKEDIRKIVKAAKESQGAAVRLGIR